MHTTVLGRASSFYIDCQFSLLSLKR